MLFIKRSLVLVAVMALLSLLFACGGGDPEDFPPLTDEDGCVRNGDGDPPGREHAQWRMRCPGPTE
jgi:hypothetical protein